MKRFQFWRIPNEQGRGWGGRIRIGRAEFSYRAYQHVYHGSPDRWVFQPAMHYDRKRQSGGTT